jgi:demethylmenaquinone methyltransferase/2-methoxy-6-polyprenyl-1,4-benzoquinol methylase
VSAVPRDGGAPAREPANIGAMFGRIAGRYDLMNRLMTAGLDGRWRRLAAGVAGLAPGDRALDVCCGTGDLAFALADSAPRAEVIGLDFSEPMLSVAREKARRRMGGGGAASQPVFVAGDVLSLPFADREFAAVTVAFGVRNVPDLPRAFAEMARVTRPGGRVVCLEITTPPPGAGRRFHEVWFERCVPLLGRLVAGDGSAYAYLPASVRRFPEPAALAGIMTDAGLRRVRFRRLGLGIVALHAGLVPTTAASA